MADHEDVEPEEFWLDAWIGRQVHYVSYGTPIRPDGSQAFSSRCRAATITEVDEADPSRVGLMVANPTGLFFHSLADGGSQFDPGGYGTGPNDPAAPSYEGGTWHWGHAA